MKEIKHRAWDTLKKVMHYDFQFIKSGEEGNDWIIFTSDKQKLSDKKHPFENPYFQKQLKITENTGKKDCKGQEYFVGDIVQTDTSIKYVDYNESLLCYGLRSFNGGATTHIADSFKIIGNIFENQELIKKKND